MSLFDEKDPESNINFVPCLTWVRRGVAKPIPDRVKLTTEELSAVISQTKKDLADIENESDNEDGETSDYKPNEKKDKTEQEIMDEYDLADYDDEEENPEGGAKLLGLGDLTAFSDPRQDPYLAQMDKDIGEEDDEDRDDFNIRSTDNLVLAGHVEGDSSTLEVSQTEVVRLVKYFLQVYVYNDVEEALYVHHDILLPSFPLALEWLSFDPESDKGGSLVAVGTMEPVIDVWDLDLVDCLEPAFRLGRKAKKKKGVTGVGHKDAVISLSWNSGCPHVFASGGVDHQALLWDLNTQDVVTSLTAHKEKVQCLAWHPSDLHTLASGACDHYVRVFDCRTEGQHKKWKVGGEVERLVWNHFQPHSVLASTDQGTVVRVDLRTDKKPVWTLSAHSEAVTGLSLSSQCPGCLVTSSQDRVLKVWDIAGPQPQFVSERDMKLGQLHDLSACPDAPFVVCVGGDKKDDNFKVWDIRETAAVRARFGGRTLENPLNTAEFGFKTADEAEQTEEMETEAISGLNSMKIEDTEIKLEPLEPAKPSGGAVSKFKKKSKDKKKKKKIL